jgi:hypothetical protein
MTATNAVGLVQSAEVSFVLAAIPDRPTAVPELNLLFTRENTLHVDYPAMLVFQSGGSPILSYELSIYDQQNQMWVSITGG